MAEQQPGTREQREARIATAQARIRDRVAARIAEADEEGRRRRAAGAPASDWAAHHGFGAEDEIYGKEL